jgi:hypothetical protein
MIYGNNVDANFEYLQRRMVEKALDALQAKHDKLAELVSEYIEIVDAGLPTDTPMLNARQALRKYLKEAALRKAVE